MAEITYEAKYSLEVTAEFFTNEHLGNVEPSNTTHYNRLKKLQKVLSDVLIALQPALNGDYPDGIKVKSRLIKGKANVTIGNVE